MFKIQTKSFVEVIAGVVLFIAAALPSQGLAGTLDRPFGLGIILGDPTGITGKYWSDSRTAYDFGISYSFNDFVLLYGDYLYSFPRAFERAKTRFIREIAPYVGIGPELFISSSGNPADRGYFPSSTNGEVGFGARIPLGLEWTPHDAPLGIFVELVPGIGFAPSTFGFFQGGVGARYYF